MASVGHVCSQGILNPPSASKLPSWAKYNKSQKHPFITSNIPTSKSSDWCIYLVSPKLPFGTFGKKSRPGIGQPKLGHFPFPTTSDGFLLDVWWEWPRPIVNTPILSKHQEVNELGLHPWAWCHGTSWTEVSTQSSRPRTRGVFPSPKTTIPQAVCRTMWKGTRRWGQGQRITVDGHNLVADTNSPCI